MQKGDTNNQQDLPTTSTATLWRSEEFGSSHEVRNYSEMVKVLSEVELPSPSPALATSCTITREANVMRFDEGQTSGTKRKAKDTEGNAETEMELPKGNQQPPHPHRVIATDINTTEKRRRYRISERIRALKALVPNCNKRDKASILGDAIEYIKFLQMQLQVMQSMGIGSPFMNSEAGQPSLQVPTFAHQFATRPSLAIQHGIPQFGFYIPTNYPVFPPYLSGLIPPLMSPRPLLYPQQPLQLPPETSFQSVYSTTPPPPPPQQPSLGTINIPTTCSQAGSTPVTTQGTQ